MSYRLANLVFFYLGWAACLAGAIRGNAWIGPAVCGLAVVIHLMDASDPKTEAGFIAMVTIAGALFDGALVVGRVYSFKSPQLLPWLVPAWLFALWALLATTMHSCLSWLSGRYKLAAALGAVSAPLSYLSGARLGALALNANKVFSLGAFAVAWGIALPLLVWFGDRVSGCRAAKEPAL